MDPQNSSVLVSKPPEPIHASLHKNDILVYSKRAQEVSDVELSSENTTDRYTEADDEDIENFVGGFKGLKERYRVMSVIGEGN
jgi:hypothetical protein